MEGEEEGEEEGEKQEGKIGNSMRHWASAMEVPAVLTTERATEDFEEEDAW